VAPGNGNTSLQLAVLFLPHGGYMITTLKQQLMSAVERQQRWNGLREEMRGANYETWKHVSELNAAEIEYLIRRICVVEYQLRSAFARSAN
jgi:hypothetical protein